MFEDKKIWIGWLINRLIYKHNYQPDDEVIVQLSKLQLDLPQNKISITTNDLDKILAKYYVDFNLDACEDLKMGFSERERDNLRSTVLSIVNYIITKNSPQDFIIKG